MSKISPFPSAENIKNENFYDLQAYWLAHFDCAEHNDDAQRALATIKTSRNYCSCFDFNGEPIKIDEFTDKFHSNSSYRFVVLRNKKTDEFLIKPLPAGLKKAGDLLRRMRRKLKIIIGEKDAA